MAFRDSSHRTKTTKPLLADPQAHAETVEGGDCLIMIYTTSGALGTRFSLKESRIRVGRGADCHIVLDGDELSRRHSLFEHRNGEWWAVDLQSTNGTYVNGLRVGERLLSTGDRIKVGSHVFKYLSGGDVEAQYHEELQRMRVQDGLTHTYLRSFLLEAVREGVARGSPIPSLVVVELSRMAELKSFHGAVASDFILQELAGLLIKSGAPNGICARWSGDTFCVMLRESEHADAMTWAASLRASIAKHPFIVDGTLIEVTTVVGVASCADAMTEAEVSRRAEEALLEAKRAAESGVASREFPTAPHGRLPVVPSFGIERCRGGFVLALKVSGAANAAGIPSTWFARLRAAVDEVVDSGVVVSSYEEEVLLLMLGADRQVELAGIGLSIESKFREHATGSPLWRIVMKIPLDEPAETILRRVLSQLETDPVHTAPSPLALDLTVETRPTSESRCNALRHAFEVALAYVVALELSAIRRSAFNTRAELSEVVEVLRGIDQDRDLTLGGWYQLADALALCANERGLGSLAIGLRDREGHQTAIAREIESAVTARNLVAHGASRDPATYEVEEARLRAGFAAVRWLLATVSRFPLVSVTEILDQADDEPTAYAAAELRGLARVFPRTTIKHAAKLTKEWCYVLLDDGQALSLAPVFFAKPCPTCKELELGWSRKLVMRERGHRVRGQGVLTDHQFELQLPGDAASDALARQISS